MKKITLLTATALTITGIGAQSLTALAAAEKEAYLSPKGNRVIYTYVSSCDTQDVQAALDKLKDCFSGITLPGCQLPGVNTPETDCPGNNCPDAETPEIEIPETESPEIESPETEYPDTDIPESTLPDTNTPGNNGGNDNTTEDSTGSSEHAFIQQVVDLVNAERAKEGLSPLTIDTKVQAAAQVRAQECEQLFSHTRPNGSSFATALQEQNVSYRSAGENIAWGQRSPQEVMNGWMNSEGHRANIMNANFTTIGVGYYQNANGTNYWCQLFTR